MTLSNISTALMYISPHVILILKRKLVRTHPYHMRWTPVKAIAIALAQTHLSST